MPEGVGACKRPSLERTVPAMGGAIMSKRRQGLNSEPPSDLLNPLAVEEELRATKRRFIRSIFGSAIDGIHIVDLETKRTHSANEMFCQMLGYSLEEIMNLGVMDIHPKEDLPYVLEQLDRLSRREITLAEDIPVQWTFSFPE